MREPAWINDLRHEVKDRYIDEDFLDIYDTKLTLGKSRELLAYLEHLRSKGKP